MPTALFHDRFLNQTHSASPDAGVPVKLKKRPRSLMSLALTCALSAVFLTQQPAAAAESMPAVTSSHAAASAPTNAGTDKTRAAPNVTMPSTSRTELSGRKYFRRSADAELLRFDISLSHASRIAFAGGERIESAVWDQQDLDLKTDSGSGQIFMRPKREGEIMIYVTTGSGDTVAIVLNAGLDKPPQNILLERAATESSGQRGLPSASPGNAAGLPMTGEDPRPAAMLAPSPAPDFVANLKRFARHVTLDREAPDILKRTSCPKPSASFARAMEKLSGLKPVVESCWTTRDLTAMVLHVKNHSPVPVLIRESALTGPSVAAIAMEKTLLRYGDATSLIYMEVLGS